MPQSDRIVVIGGTGFIGTALVRLLVDASHQVTVVSRQARPLPPGVKFAKGDLADRGRMRQLIDGATVVYHLGTGGGPGWADFERDFVGGARHVAEACLDAGVRRLIYTSSIAALYLGGRGVITGDTPVDSQPQRRSLYARAKVGAEAELMRWRQEHRLPVVILRPGVVVGRGGILEHGGIGQWPADIRVIGWGRGTNPIPFVLVEDVASAITCALDAPGIEGRTFNLAGDVFLSAREYVRLLAEESLRDYRFYPRSLMFLQSIEISKWLMKALARKAENPFPSSRDLASRALTAPLDCSDAKTALGWKPNADLSVFVREVISSALRPVAAGDLRRAATA